MITHPVIAWQDKSDELVREILVSGIKPPLAGAIQTLAEGDVLRWKTTDSESSNSGPSGWLIVGEEGVAAWGDLAAGEGFSCACTNPKTAKGRVKTIGALLASRRRDLDLEDRKLKIEAARLLFETAEQAGSDIVHRYLEAHHIAAGPARIAGGDLLVPGFDGDGNLQLVVKISEDGLTERFIGSVSGASLVIGEIDDAKVVLACESFPDAMSLHRCVSHPVVVGFTVANMKFVARRLAERRIPVVLCATSENETRMREAGLQHDESAIVMPGSAASFNALANSQGLGAVCDIVEPVANRLRDAGAAVVALEMLGLEPVALEDGNPQVHVRATRGVYVVRAKKDSIARLGPDVVERLGASMQAKDGIDYDKIYKTLYRACARVGERSSLKERREGIWRLRDGSIHVHDGSRTLVDGQVIYAPTGGSFTKPHKKYDDVQALMAAFHGELSKRYDTFLATATCGWLVSALAAGTLDFRPIIWLLGKAGAGKTWLVEVIKTVLGEAVLAPDGSISTAAGLRRALRTSSRPVVVDESEPNNSMHSESRGRQILEILQLARSSCTGTSAYLGTSDGGGGGEEFLLQSSFCFSSISSLAQTAADETRVLPLEIRCESDYRSELLSDRESLVVLGQKIVAVIVARADELKAAIRDAANEEGRKRNSRAGQTIGTLLGCARFITGIEDLTLESVTVEERFSASDSHDLLANIAAIKVNLPTGATTIGHLLAQIEGGSADVLPCEYEMSVTRPHGKAPHLFVSNRSAALAKALGLQNSTWRDQLLRLPGAYAGTGRVNGLVTPRRGVLIPLSEIIVPEIADESSGGSNVVRIPAKSVAEIDAIENAAKVASSMTDRIKASIAASRDGYQPAATVQLFSSSGVTAAGRKRP